MIREFQTADTEQVMQIWLNGNEDAHPFISKLSEELDEAKGGTEYTMIRNEKWNNSGGHFYFVRHGQTVWNVENKICGATDIALTELGHQQAIETGENTHMFLHVGKLRIRKDLGRHILVLDSVVSEQGRGEPAAQIHLLQPFCTFRRNGIAALP